MTVHWTNTAVAHLAAIYEYIARDSPNYAQRMVDRLTAGQRTVPDSFVPSSDILVPPRGSGKPNAPDAFGGGTNTPRFACVPAIVLVDVLEG